MLNIFIKGYSNVDTEITALVDHIRSKGWNCDITIDDVILIRVATEAIGLFVEDFSKDEKLNWIEYGLQFEH